MTPRSSWAGRALEAIVILVAVAFGAQLVWNLLQPLIGPLLVLAVLVGLLVMVLRRRRWW